MKCFKKGDDMYYKEIVFLILISIIIIKAFKEFLMMFILDYQKKKINKIEKTFSELE